MTIYFMSALEESVILMLTKLSKIIYDLINSKNLYTHSSVLQRIANYIGAQFIVFFVWSSKWGIHLDKKKKNKQNVKKLILK